MRKKENRPSLRAVLFYKRELQQNQKGVQSYPKAVAELLEELQTHGIRVTAEEQTPEEITLAGLCKRDNFDPEELLVLAASDAVLEMAAKEQIAAIAYENPEYPDEDRMASGLLVQDFSGMDYLELYRAWQRYHKIPWTILETKRCVVRELELADLDALFALYEQPHMTDYMEPLYDRAEEESYQRAYIANMYGFYGYGMWLVIERSTGRVIGRAGLENREMNGTTELELGYAIAASHQRQGYATEVCVAILQYAGKQHLGEQIHCLIEPENEPSIHLARKLGFSCAGKVMDRGKTYLDYCRLLEHNSQKNA